MKPWNRPNGNRCAWEGCDRSAVGKSKYCATHRQAARAAFMAKVREANEERRAREEEFEHLLGEAEQRAGSPLAELAAVVVKPGTCALARYLKSDGWHKGECGGVESPPFPTRSKAEAYRQVLTRYGYRAEVRPL